MYVVPRTDEVQMIGNGIDPPIRVTARLAIAPRFVMGAANHVEQMRIHAVADEGLAVVVPIDAPRVRRAIGVRFPDVPHRMIAIHAAVEANPLALRRAGFAHRRPIRAAVRAVEPAIRPPSKAVGQVMGIRMIAQSVQEHLRFAVRPVIAVVIGNEIEEGRRHDPGAAEADFDAGHIIQLVVEEGPLVAAAVAVGVFEDHDPIARLRAVVRIIVCFGHPQPPAVVDAEADRLLHIWLGREERDVETLRHDHRAGRFLGRQRGIDDRLGGAGGCETASGHRAQDWKKDSRHCESTAVRASRG